MTTTTGHLPLDLTGDALTNRILGEEHTLIRLGNRPYRLLIPCHGAFYGHDLGVYHGQHQMLQRNVHYKTIHLHEELVELTGRPLWGAVLIMDASVPDTVYVNYRALGGTLSGSARAIESLLTTLGDIGTEIDWEDIVGKPREFIPAPHQHEWWQLYGVERTIEALNRIRHAVTVGRDAIFAHEREWGDHYLDLATTAVGEFAERPGDHYTNFNNPHQLTKAQVGLGLVNNFPLATNAQALAGTSHSLYLTPAIAWAAINGYAVAALNAHRYDYSNPHNGSIYMLDGRDRYLIDYDLAQMWGLWDTVGNAPTLEGTTVAQMIDMARQGINIQSFTQEASVPPLWLGSGFPDANTVLRGNGTWVPYTEVFDNVAPSSPPTAAFAGLYTTAQQAIVDIQSRFSDINRWPVGSVAMYTIRWNEVTDGANGVFNYVVSRYEVAVRTAGGWQLT